MRSSVYLWNMVGSLTNAVSSILLTMIVTRLLGSGYDSDIFSLAYSTALMLSAIGLFEVRQFQTSDVTHEHEFSDYLFMRCITCGAMMLSIIIFSAINGYDLYKSTIMFLVCFYMMIGSFEDVYHGLFQVENRLDVAGKSLTIRIVVSVFMFAVALLITKNLTLSCAMLCVGSILVFVFYDLVMERKITEKNVKPKSMFKHQKALFISCLPLFVCSFSSLYILNAPKYAIDSFLSQQGGVQTAYTILIMPAAVINLFSIFVFRPMMLPMARTFNERNKKEFVGIIRKIFIYIAVVSVCVIALGYLFGTQFLELLYNVPMSEYRIDLLIILIAGAVSATLPILQYVVTIMRYQYRLLFGYLLSAIFAFVTSYILVPKYGIFGGSISYLLTYLFIAISFVVIIFSCYLSYKKKKNAQKTF